MLDFSGFQMIWAFKRSIIHTLVSIKSVVEEVLK